MDTCAPGRRDETVLTWMAQAVRHGTDPKATLDVGCASGNYTLMLEIKP